MRMSNKKAGCEKKRSSSGFRMLALARRE